MPLRACAQTAPKPTSPTGNSIGKAPDFDARARQLHNSFAAQRTLASRRSCSAHRAVLICLCDAANARTATSSTPPLPGPSSSERMSVTIVDAVVGQCSAANLKRAPSSSKRSTPSAPR
jgi:hypothetical protein